MKIIKFEDAARVKLLEGAEIIYKAVATTLSPRGRNVAIARQWGAPIVVHDGVTVARDVEDADEYRQMAISLIREAAAKTNDEAGDGTTTSVLLAYQIIAEGMKLLEKGYNPMKLRREMDSLIPVIRKAVADQAVPVKENIDVEKVAFISSADAEIGKLVAQAVAKVGTDGLISVEEGQAVETRVDYTEGMQIDHGYTAPQFVTNPDRAEAVLENPAIAILNKKVTMINEIVPLIETIIRKTKTLVIVGEVGGDALSILVANKFKGTINALAVNPPSYGDRRGAFMEDLALITGGQVISDELGLPLEQFKHVFDAKAIGSAKLVTATRDATVFIGGGGDKTKVAERAEQLKKRIEAETSIYQKEILQERLAKLTTGIAVIKVGAKTQIDMREKVERVKDAVSAARAAGSEGIVIGGGIAFLRLVAPVAKAPASEGRDLLIRVFKKPIEKLLINAGESPERMDRLISEVIKRGGNYGYNVESGEVEDLIAAGVIDPAKVVRLALENAIAVAGMILTTDCLIAEKREEGKDAKIV